MEGITQHDFHRLQALIEGGFVQDITGPLEVKHSSENPENVLYKNSREKWLMRWDGYCYAHPRLIRFLTRFDKKMKGKS